MFKKMIKDKRGVSELVSSAAMVFVLSLFFVLMLQISVYNTAQAVVHQAAFEAARAAAKSPTPYATAVQAAKDFGKNYIRNWENSITVTMPVQPTQPGQIFTVNVTYNVPILSNLFKSTTVSSSSTQIWEEMP
jgi:Flp pilus assembly protein TadG